MKKIVGVLSIFFSVFLTGMDKFKGSFPQKKDPLKDDQKTKLNRQKLSGSDGTAQSPKRTINSMGEFKDELKKTKEERKRPEDNK